MKKIDKFETLMRISRDIEHLVMKKKISYIDAIVLYSDENKIEIEHIGNIIANNNFIRSQIEIEAIKLNCIKGNK